MRRSREGQLRVPQDDACGISFDAMPRFDPYDRRAAVEIDRRASRDELRVQSEAVTDLRIGEPDDGIFEFGGAAFRPVAEAPGRHCIDARAGAVRGGALRD